MFNIVGIALPLTIHIDIKLRRISHSDIHVGSETGKQVQHVSAGELIQAELCDGVNTGVHTSQRSDQYHTDRFAVLIPDVFHDAE